MNGIEQLDGQFLLAMPGLEDVRFHQSVIAMCAHDAGGAFGLCVNRPIEGLSVPALMRQLDIDPQDTPHIPVLFGGPVDPERGFVLHSLDFSGLDTHVVAGRWALTGTRDILEGIAEGAGPLHWLAVLGYAGWEGGQLEEEMTTGGWFTTPGTVDLLWNTPAEERWRAGYAGAGVDVNRLSSGAGRA